MYSEIQTIKAMLRKLQRKEAESASVMSSVLQENTRGLQGLKLLHSDTNEHLRSLQVDIGDNTHDLIQYLQYNMKKYKIYLKIYTLISPTEGFMVGDLYAL